MLFFVRYCFALIPFKSQLASTYSVTTMYIIIKLDMLESEILSPRFASLPYELRPIEELAQGVSIDGIDSAGWSPHPPLLSNFP